MDEKEKERKRLERQAEMAKKQAQIKDLKNRAKAATGITAQEITGASNLKDIMKIADKLTGHQGEYPSEPEPVKPAEEPKPVVATEGKPVVSNIAATKKRKVTLSFVNLGGINIPPVELPTYQKSTQTNTVAVGEDEKVATVRKATKDTGVDAPAKPKEEAKVDTKPKEEEAKKNTELGAEDKEKIIQSAEFADFVTKTSKLMERALYVSSKIDIGVDYTQADDDDKSNLEDAVEMGQQLKLFDERWSKYRAVTDLNFSSKHPDLLLTAYSASEGGNPNDPDGLVLLWSTHNPKPEYRFHSQSPVTTALFDKYSPTIVIGGTYSGQIVLWDTRARHIPVQQSPLSSVGHTHPVFCLDHVGTKNANHLISISTDGRLCVWTPDKLAQPIEALELHNKQTKLVTATAPVAVTCLSFPNDTEVNEFFVGSEEGAVYQGFRFGEHTGIADRFDGHSGPVTSIDFHPASGAINFSNLLLTSSTDWTCKLWNPRVSKKPLYSFQDSDDYVYEAKWCPTHPSMFGTVDGTGSLDLWDLNEDTESPVLKTKVSQRALNRMKWSADGKRILTGDSLGYVYLYDTRDICVPRTEEWKIFEENLSIMTELEQDVKEDKKDTL